MGSLVWCYLCEIHPRFSVLNVAHSFSLPYSIPLCEFVTIYFIANGPLVIFNFRLLPTVPLRTFYYVSFGKHTLYVFWVNTLVLKCWIRRICKFSLRAHCQILFQSNFTYLHFHILVNIGCSILFFFAILIRIFLIHSYILIRIYLNIVDLNMCLPTNKIGLLFRVTQLLSFIKIIFSSFTYICIGHLYFSYWFEGTFYIF